MPVLKLIRGAAVVLAAVGIVAPLPNVQAADSRAAQSRLVAATIAADVTQSKDGSFNGRIVDHSGAAVEHADVMIRQNNKVVTQGHTDVNGLFAFKNLKPGTYQVSSGTTEGLFRVWNEQSAPPASKKNALIVLGHDGARGQYGGVDDYGPYGMTGYPALDPTLVLMTAGIIAAVVISAITLERVNSIQNTVNNIPSSP